LKKLLCLLFILCAISLQGQSLGTRYFWSDTLQIATGVNTSTFTAVWEQATFYTNGALCYFKVGAPDVADWSSRDYILLPAGSSFSIGPNPKLKKLSVYLASGTGVLYIVGYKKEAQY